MTVEVGSQAPDFSLKNQDGEFVSSTDVKGRQAVLDTPWSLKAWGQQEGYGFPLLSDFWPHGAVAESYGVFSAELGVAVRGTFLVDTEGVVRSAERNGPGDARDQQGWRDALEQLV